MFLQAVLEEILKANLEFFGSTGGYTQPPQTSSGSVHFILDSLNAGSSFFQRHKLSFIIQAPCFRGLRPKRFDEVVHRAWASADIDFVEDEDA